MRSFITFIAIVALAARSADSFAATSQRRAAFGLHMTAMDSSFTADSGLTADQIPMFIENLNAENFEESIKMLEPLLVNECVGDKCDLFLQELRDKAAAIGKELPAGYAPSHH